ncbi:rod-binding protein [Roseomonas sp. GC11]|uniref:rod-binding protein n=1 Tax=Roseomonas sp. GC11 TaxID=2950546 RepID=UPI00210E7F46|nr:rod-binding protein [Roseomonas sp. GC11]MCQ4159936.1 rod-binding protein [Roseomonas sp. GC11]
MSMDGVPAVGGLPAAGAARASGPNTPRRLAQQLEASFAAELLRAARPSQKEGLAGRGTGGEAFDSFMDQALGDALVSKGGLGLTKVLEETIAARARPGHPASQATQTTQAAQDTPAPQAMAPQAVVPQAPAAQPGGVRP